MNVAASEPGAEASPVWRVYQMNDYEWWIGHARWTTSSARYSEVQGCSEDRLKIRPARSRNQVRELTDAELDRLQFVDDESFASARIRTVSARSAPSSSACCASRGPSSPQFFATTEI
jgi:hypothetical protein